MERLIVGKTINYKVVSERKTLVLDEEQVARIRSGFEEELLGSTLPSSTWFGIRSLFEKGKISTLSGLSEVPDEVLRGLPRVGSRRIAKIRTLYPFNQASFRPKN